MARAIVNETLFGAGYTGVKKINISGQINNNISGYYKTLKISELPFELHGKHVLDITSHINYMLDAIEFACDRAISSINKLNSKESLIVTKMSKRGVGAEINVRTAAKITGLSESGARAVLNKLVVKGILSKHLRGKRMIYTLMKI